RAPGPGAMPGLLTPASSLTAGPSKTPLPARTAAPNAATETPNAPTATTGPAAPTLTPSATLTPTLPGQVIQSGGGLRLRKSPGTTGAIVDSLAALERLTRVGRTEDSGWLQVVTDKQAQGWVKAAWVKVTGELSRLAVTGQAVDAPDEALAYLSGVTAHARQIFLAGQALGNH